MLIKAYTYNFLIKLRYLVFDICVYICVALTGFLCVFISRDTISFSIQSLFFNIEVLFFENMGITIWVSFIFLFRLCDVSAQIHLNRFLWTFIEMQSSLIVPYFVKHNYRYSLIWSHILTYGQSLNMQIWIDICRTFKTWFSLF